MCLIGILIIRDMDSIHWKIVSFLISIIVIFFIFFVNIEISEYFHLMNYPKNPSWIYLLFFERSGCDPVESEITIFNLIFTFFVGVLASFFIVRLIKKIGFPKEKKLKEHSNVF